MAHRATLYVLPGQPTQPQDCEVCWQSSHEDTSNMLPASPCNLSTWSEVAWEDLCAIDLILPTEWITSLDVKLPGSNKRIMRAALPYAVEEFLIQPLEQYHIATVSTEAEGSTGVAVIAAALMATWCTWIDERFPRVRTRFLVDGWLLPRTDNETAIAQIDGRVLIRYGDRLCSVTNDNMREPVLESLRNTRPNAGPPRRLEPPDLGAKGGGSQELAAALMSRAESFTGPDLRQDRYKSQAVLDWRLPAATLAASVLLCAAMVIGSNLYTASVYDERRTTILTTTEQAYRETFAATGRLVNLPAQARQHLEALQAQWRAPEERPEFFPLFNAVTQALATWSQDYTYTLRQLSYVERDRAINLDLVTDDMGHINRLQQFFAEQGLQAAVLSASEDEGQFTGRMRIRYEPE